MNKAMPIVKESSEELRTQLKSETHPLKRQRLHALYLVASGQAKSRLAVAQLLGVGRNAVGDWLRRYVAQGLTGLLDVHTPPGKKPTLNTEQEAQLKAALARPEGFSSYGAVQRWIKQTLGVEMSYPAVHKLVRYKLGATLKVPRRSHEKKAPTP